MTYTEKFSENDGCLPLNIGFNLAGGEFVYFIDANDFLAKNALETLFNAAKENDAEAVYSVACYDLRKPKDFRIVRDSKGSELIKQGLKDTVALIIDEPEENLRQISAKANNRGLCIRFVRRDFLSANKILFPKIPEGVYHLWSINVCCHAKRLLRLPTPLYFYRSYASFDLQKKKRPQERVAYWVSAFVTWLKALDELTGKIDILKKNISLCYPIAAEYFKFCLSQISDEVIKRFPSKDVYEILFNKLAVKENFGSLTIPFFLSVISNREKLVAKTQRNIDELTNEVNRQKKEIIDSAKQFRPAVSVIIPLYNAEKYVGECLDSILAQTFQNFEVIVADDCSTDSSYSVVESYITKFDGRLSLLKMAKNSGGGAMPRNKGLSMSRGEYIFFMDADDVITKTALEELYTLAKKFDADVVYCEKYLMSSGVGEEFVKKAYVAVGKAQRPPFVNEPTVETSDLIQRLNNMRKKISG